MGSPAPPPAPPDPVATARAQAGMNVDTAQAQQLTNAVNQVTPWGTLTYEQGPGYDFVNADGKTVHINGLTARQTLSPEQQRLFDLNQRTQENIANIGQEQSNRIRGLLNSPVDLTNEAVEKRLYDLGTRRLNPQFAQDEEALRSRLANSGIRQGSAAWDAEMRRFGQNKNDALDNLLLTGRGQAVQEALAARNQPINEITALMTGSQVHSPSFTNTPQAQVAGTDYIGAVNNNYQGQLQAYNYQNQANNGMWNALGQLGGAALGMFKFTPSDKRIKENKQKVGKLDNGLDVYSYNYKGDETPQIGLMAQEVKKKNPRAVKKINGLLHVDYAQAVKKGGDRG